jgi:hypothetical protein
LKFIKIQPPTLDPVAQIGSVHTPSIGLISDTHLEWNGQRCFTVP